MARVFLSADGLAGRGRATKGLREVKKSAERAGRCGRRRVRRPTSRGSLSEYWRALRSIAEHWRALGGGLVGEVTCTWVARLTIGGGTGGAGCVLSLVGKAAEAAHYTARLAPLAAKPHMQANHAMLGLFCIKADECWCSNHVRAGPESGGLEISASERRSREFVVPNVHRINFYKAIWSLRIERTGRWRMNWVLVEGMGLCRHFASRARSGVSTFLCASGLMHVLAEGFYD